MLIFAHRGSHNRRTSENTLTAFQRAVEFGAHGIEFDLRTSRDDVPVAMHDEHLHRVAGDSRRVRDLTARELQSLALRGEGCIPTLNDITSSVPAPVWLDIEIKDREALEHLIKKLKTSAALRARTIVSSFVLDDLARVKQEMGDVKTLCLSMSRTLLVRKSSYLRRLREADVWGVGFPSNILTHSRAEWFRGQGLALAAWDLQPLKREAHRVARFNPDIAIVYKIEELLRNSKPGIQDF